MMEGLLKTPEVMHDFIYNLWWIHMMGMGEKPRNIYKNKETKEKNPFGCPPIPPSIKLEVDCFPGERAGNKSDLP